MRHFDLSPLYKSTVGFDRLASILDSLAPLDAEANGYPPYNIERVGDNSYRITMAVAGFGEDEINVEVKENALTIQGGHKTETKDANYLHRGIATRAFKRQFQLADYMEVTGAALENGLLHVDLVRELPEKMKPRSIEINTTSQPVHAEIEA